MNKEPNRYDSWARYQRILSALREREHTAKTLSELLNHPESTVRRDLLWMEKNAPGVLVREDGKKKFFRSEALPELLYSGALCLLMGARAVSAVEGSEAWEGLKPLIQHAEEKLGRDALRKVCSLQGDFQLKDIQQEVFDVLIEAIAQSFVVTLYYQSPKRMSGGREVLRPLSLVRWKDRLYLIVQSDERPNEIGARRLDRVEDVQLTEPRRAFKYPSAEVYDPSRLFAYSVGPFIHTEAPQVPVILRFHGEEASRHRGYGWPVRTVIRRAEPLEVELWCHIDHSLKHFIMRLGAGVEVVAPDSLRSELRQQLIDALTRYESPL